MSRTDSKRYRAAVCGLMTGADCRFIVCGSVRGLVSEHRTIKGAIRSLLRDGRGCKAQGGYSDALVYAWDDSKMAWEPHTGLR